VVSPSPLWIPDQVRDDGHYRSASFVGNNRVVFNIKGNDYRLIVAIVYRVGIVYIKFIGTHAQYDAVDAATIDMN
jgi:mRNA interferase HigB